MAEAALLDGRLQEFSAQFYAAFARMEPPVQHPTMSALKRAIETYQASNDSVRAIAAAVANVGLVEKNLHANEALFVYDALLKANAWKVAARLHERLTAQGDRAVASAVSFALAQHHFARGHWDRAAQLLQTAVTDLGTEDLHHARLLHGIALQRLRKHRAALAQYAKIPKTSRYYATARLNMAVANIRQDWWTDAHGIMREVVARDGVDAAFADRVYTVWGYSLLRQQYFRHARDMFRNVGLDGEYTHRALLGIALSAAHQEDYVGALNAVTILKGRNRSDLPVDEAHLLMPYMYEKLGQRTTATAGYAQAIAYYEGRVAAIERAKRTPAALLRDSLLATEKPVLAVADEIVDLEDVLPAAFFANLKRATAFRPYIDPIGDARLKRDHAELESDYATAVHNAVASVLDARLSFINHYMSQARFGLAAIDDEGATRP